MEAEELATALFPVKAIHNIAAAVTAIAEINNVPIKRGLFREDILLDLIFRESKRGYNLQKFMSFIIVSSRNNKNAECVS